MFFKTRPQQGLAGVWRRSRPRRMGLAWVTVEIAAIQL